MKVKYKVKVGTLGFEDGIFQRGDIIEVTVERAALFDKLDIEPVKELDAAKPVEPVKPDVAAVEPVKEVPKPVESTAQAKPAADWGTSKTAVKKTVKPA